MTRLTDNAKGLAAVAVIGLLAACGGCRGERVAPKQAATPPVTSDAACASAAELAELDPRRPVPLQPMMAWHQKQNMQGHLLAVQRISDGLARADWDQVKQASVELGASPQMQQTCERMGSGAEGFTELALDFHQRADAIGEAARAEDVQAVLQATSHTLQACTSCHATYRQEIVDSETWTKLTAHADMAGH